MTASPAPKADPDEPGRWLPNGAAAKAGLSRSVLDVAFGEFRRQVSYKAGWYGSQIGIAPRFFPSSKTCSRCGAVKAKLALSDRVYLCDACGLKIDRDHNAALNIAATAVVSSPPDGGDEKRPAHARVNPPHTVADTEARKGPPVLFAQVT